MFGPRFMPGDRVAVGLGSRKGAVGVVTTVPQPEVVYVQLDDAIVVKHESQLIRLANEAYENEAMDDINLMETDA